jgi:hypothetical protein
MHRATQARAQNWTIILNTRIGQNRRTVGWKSDPKNWPTGDKILGRAWKHNTGDDFPGRGIEARWLESKQGHGLPKPSENEGMLGSKNQRGEKWKVKKILVAGNKNVLATKMKGKKNLRWQVLEQKTGRHSLLASGKTIDTWESSAGWENEISRPRLSGNRSGRLGVEKSDTCGRIENKSSVGNQTKTSLTAQDTKSDRR